MGLCDGRISCFLIERKIDGKVFAYLMREDFSIIYPGNDKFLLGCNLYRISQKTRRSTSRNTHSILDELSEVEDDSTSHSSFPSAHYSLTSTPAYSSSRESRTQEKPTGSADQDGNPWFQLRRCEDGRR